MEPQNLLTWSMCGKFTAVVCHCANVSKNQLINKLINKLCQLIEFLKRVSGANSITAKMVSCITITHLRH